VSCRTILRTVSADAAILSNTDEKLAPALQSLGWKRLIETIARKSSYRRDYSESEYCAMYCGTG
jgi:hypothetical protein